MYGEEEMGYSCNTCPDRKSPRPTIWKVAGVNGENRMPRFELRLWRLLRKSIVRHWNTFLCGPIAATAIVLPQISVPFEQVILLVLCILC